MSPVPSFPSLLVVACGRAVFARCMVAAAVVLAVGAVLWSVPWAGSGAGWVAHAVLGMVACAIWSFAVLVVVAARARDAGWSPSRAVGWVVVAGVLALRGDGVWGDAV